VAEVQTVLTAIDIVEDDPSLLRALGRLLRVAGFSVRAFESAEEFLKTAPGRLPDCLVLDIHLGDLTGFDLHERLRARGSTVPTIFITGHDDPTTREQARRSGAAAYLRKPFDDKALISAIEQAVAQR
jgi:FixJ family two-component response regulator